MKIETILTQYRRDFTAIYICEICGAKETNRGYDDRNFHDNILPDMPCKACGRSRKDAGIVSGKTETRYREWETV